LAERFFEIVYERLMAAHFWNFATVRTVLQPAAGITPAYGFGTAFAVPPDYLHIQRVETGIRYQREGDYFVADELTLPLTYTRRVEDVTKWPPHFTEAFVRALTAEFATQVPEAHKLLPSFIQLADQALRRGKMHDGQEGSSPVLRMPDLILARRGWRAS
jgi:hypothetical protein